MTGSTTARVVTVQCRYCGRLVRLLKGSRWAMCPSCRISTEVPR